MEENYYELLGVSREATLEEIKKAYRKQAMKYHPDRNPGDKTAEEMMKKVNVAFEVLSDPDKRKSYDRDIEHKQSNDNYSYYSYYSYNSEQRTGYEREPKSKYKDLEWYIKFWNTHTTKNTSRKKATTNEEKIYEILEKIKKSYANSREFERNCTYKSRRNFVNDELFYGTELFDNCKNFEEYLSKLFTKETLYRLGVHGVVEAMYIAVKLKKLRTDDLTTYIMRNRRTFAGILLAMYLLFGLPGNTKENVEQPVSNPTTQETTEETVKTSLTEDYTLYRIHTVEAGDSLSILSSESNTTIKYLKQINELTSDNIYIGQKLIIPYVVDKEELKYYTTSVELTDETLEDIAEKYNTDLKTLYSLNVEAFYFDGDGYILLTDTILVPTFPTLSEVDELKKADSYRKVNQ